MKQRLRSSAEELSLVADETDSHPDLFLILLRHGIRSQRNTATLLAQLATRSSGLTTVEDPS